MSSRPTLIPRPMLEKAARRFRLLGEPSRLEILSLLHAEGPLPVNEIVAATGMGQANVSKHLSALAREGIVTRRQDGLFAFYEIADESLSAICRLVCNLNPS